MKAFFYSCLALFVLLSLISSNHVTTRPTFVAEIFRNGARQPANQYNPFNFKRPGQLTPLGLRQQYNLGLLMQKKYGYLLDRSSPAYIFAESFNSDKCRQSAEAQVFGALQGKDPSELPVNLARAPLIPVFDDIQLVDDVMADLDKNHSAVTYNFHPIFYGLHYPDRFRSLSSGPESCGLLKVMRSRRENDAEGAKIYEYLTETVTGIKKLGYQVDDIASLSNFGDALQIMYLEGRNNELPEVLRYGTPMYKDAIFANEWYLTYYLVGDKKEAALQSLSFLNQVIGWFWAEVPTFRQLPLTFAFMSGDEANLLSLLNLYEIVDHNCLYENHKASKSGQPIPFAQCIFPKYASQIIFEFHRQEFVQHVRFLYNGKPLKVCSTDSEFLCEFRLFAKETQERLQNLAPDLHEQYCDPNNAPKLEATTETKDETKEETTPTQEPNTSSGDQNSGKDTPSSEPTEQPKNETTTSDTESSDNVINTDNKETNENEAEEQTDGSDSSIPKTKVITASSSPSGRFAVLKVFIFCTAPILVLILLILIYRAVVAHKKVYTEFGSESNSKESKKDHNESSAEESPHIMKEGIANDLEHQIATPDNVRLVLS